MANRSSSFLSRVVIVLTGGALAQVINLLTMPIITRIYPPDVFGFFANVTLLAGFIVPFITLSLPMVAVLIRNERHSEEFVKANIRLSLSISFVLIVMAYFFFIAGGGPLLLYGVLMSCALGVQECLIFLFIKKRYFAIRSLFLVVQAGVVSALKILFGLLYSGNESLIYAMLVGYILINLSMYLN
jgi:O-antigen/teichoic acid export membrane protein